MVSMPRIVAHGLLERQVLLAAEEELTADRRSLILALENGGSRYLQAAAQRKRIGRIPPGRDHDLQHLGFRADQGHVDRVSGNAVSRIRNAGHLLKFGMPVSVAL